MKSCISALSTLLLLMVLTNPAHAVNPDEMLSDQQLEQRARLIGQDLRCLVCQNQSIDESDAELAHDLRALIRTRLTRGDSNTAIVEYIVNRYGDQVLLTPPFKSETYLLWFSPFIFGLLALIATTRFYRHRRLGKSRKQKSLSAQEKKRLDEILNHSED